MSVVNRALRTSRSRTWPRRSAYHASSLFSSSAGAGSSTSSNVRGVTPVPAFGRRSPRDVARRSRRAGAQRYWAWHPNLPFSSGPKSIYSALALRGARPLSRNLQPLTVANGTITLCLSSIVRCQTTVPLAPSSARHGRQALMRKKVAARTKDTHRPAGAEATRSHDRSNLFVTEDAAIPRVVSLEDGRRQRGGVHADNHVSRRWSGVWHLFPCLVPGPGDQSRIGLLPWAPPRLPRRALTPWTVCSVGLKGPTQPHLRPTDVPCRKVVKTTTQ